MLLHSHKKEEINVDQHKTNTIDNYSHCKIQDDKADYLNKELFLHLCSKNLPFSVWEGIHFENFCSGLNKNYDIPCATTFRTNLLCSVFRAKFLELYYLLSTIRNGVLILDGTTINRRSIYGFSVFANDHFYPIGIKDISDIRHSVVNLKELTLSIMKIYDLEFGKHIIAVVTDNPNPMVSLKEELIVVSDNSIFSVKCGLHIYNLIIKYIMSYKDSLPILQIGCKILNFVLKSPIWCSTMRDIQKEHNISNFLNSYTAIRFYSIGNTLKALDNFTPHINTILESKKVNGNNNNNHNVNNMYSKLPDIKNEDITNIFTPARFGFYYQENKTVLAFVSPIIDAIGRLECDDSTIGDIYKEFIIIHNKINNIKPVAKFEPLKNYCFEVIDFRFKQYIDDASLHNGSDIYLLSFYLTPKFKSVAISMRYNFKDINFMMIKLIKRLNYTKTQSDDLMDELAIYQNNIKPYDFNVEQLSMKPKIMWKAVERTQIDRELPKLALTLFSIICHSAGIERLFSSLGLISTDLRASMNTNTLEMLSTIKVLDSIQIKEKGNNNKSNEKIAKKRKLEEETDEVIILDNNTNINSNIRTNNITTSSSSSTINTNTKSNNTIISYMTNNNNNISHQSNNNTSTNNIREPSVRTKKLPGYYSDYTMNNNANNLSTPNEDYNMQILEHEQELNEIEDINKEVEKSKYNTKSSPINNNIITIVNTFDVMLFDNIMNSNIISTETQHKNDALMDEEELMKKYVRT